MLLLVAVVGCSSSESEDTIKIRSNLEEAGYTVQTELNSDHLFEQKLLNVKPIVYVNGDPHLTVYPLATPEERERAYNQFIEKTAIYNMMAFDVYEDESHLFFFTHYDEELPLEGLTKLEGGI